MKKYLTILLTLFIVSCDSLEKRTEKFLQDPVKYKDELTLDEWKSQALKFANYVSNEGIVSPEQYDRMCYEIDNGYQYENKFNYIEVFDQFSPCRRKVGEFALTAYWTAMEDINTFKNELVSYGRNYPLIKKIYDFPELINSVESLKWDVEQMENRDQYIGKFYIIQIDNPFGSNDFAASLLLDMGGVNPNVIKCKMRMPALYWSRDSGTDTITLSKVIGSNLHDMEVKITSEDLYKIKLN